MGRNNNLIIETKEPGEVDTRLSYSSASVLTECEQKYWHRKIAKTPIDPDVEEDYHAFSVGKAFHKVLEDNFHFDKFPMAVGVNILPMVIEVCKEFKVEEEAPMVTAMIIKYINLHRRCGLRVFKCELPVSYQDKFYGIIDCILWNYAGDWWIRDMKTAARFDSNLMARLPRDPQLNLYAFFATHQGLGGILGLKRFLGTRYNVTTKTTANEQPADKNTEGFIKRLVEKHVKSFEIIIPVEVMSTAEIWSEHSDLWNRADELRNGVAPRKNFRNCVDKYNKNCPYWSRCHSKTNTDCKSIVTVYDEETFKQEEAFKELI